MSNINVISGGPNAPWRKPVAVIAKHPDTLGLSALMCKPSPKYPNDSWSCEFAQYTFPVYDMYASNITVTVRTALSSNMNGERIVWNTTWKPSPGTDGQIIVLSGETGREWNFHKAVLSGTELRCNNANLVMTGKTLESHTPADFRTKENGFRPSRGCGIQYSAMLVRPWEVAQGHIDHALAGTAWNTSGQAFVPPATKLEHNTGAVGIPEGTRFALKVSDKQIETWITNLRVARYIAPALRTIARALRDYGWFITDTTGASGFKFEADESAKADWATLGLEPRTRDFRRKMLQSLIKPSMVYALVDSDHY